LFAVLAAVGVVVPGPASASTCADDPNQAVAQRAVDTQDADGDGIYCESLPCPCSTAAGGGGASPTGEAKPKASCTRPGGLVDISFSATKYPNIRRHFLDAVRNRWPTVLVVNRRGAEARRARLLEGYATREGMDRDEYPPAAGRPTSATSPATRIARTAR
jgi:hypothetical protein